MLYGARYSPDDNPAERIWAALKNYVANTAVSWPGRLRQIHSFFRARSPDQMLATAAPWASPRLPPGLRAELLECRLAGAPGMALRGPGERRREMKSLIPAQTQTLQGERQGRLQRRLSGVEATARQPPGPLLELRL